MSKAEKTRQFIIEKTANLFNKNGYAGTSLSDIVTATGLTKGSIYGNFDNKDAVAVAVFEYNFTRLKTKMYEKVAAEATAQYKLLAIVTFYRENWRVIFENGGCPLLNAAAEVDDVPNPLKANVVKSFKQWVKSLASIIEDGKRKQELKQDIDATYYATTIIALIEGGILMSKISNEPTALYAILDRIVAIIEQELLSN